MTDRPTRRQGRPSGSRGAELVEIARQVFVELGFARATMDAVAARAHISKSSLYQAHRSKDALFAEVVRDWARRGRDAMRPHLDQLLAADDLTTGLRTLVGTIQAAILHPDVLRMRNLVAAETARFPEVAADYVADSWDRNIAALAEALAELARRGELEIDEPQLGAHQLTWLAVGGPLNELTLRGAQAEVDSDRLAKIASSAVDTFLARYSPPSPGTRSPELQTKP